MTTAPPEATVATATTAIRRSARRGTGLPLLVLRRLLMIPVVMWVLATLVFVGIRLIPGSPAEALAVKGTSGLTAEEIHAKVEALNAALGLDQPILVQYFRYL